MHTRIDQLLPQLLMKQFDILPTQCMHIGYMLEQGLVNKSNRKAMNRNGCNQKANPALKYCIIDEITAMRTWTFFQLELKGFMLVL